MDSLDCILRILVLCLFTYAHFIYANILKSKFMQIIRAKSRLWKAFRGKLHFTLRGFACILPTAAFPRSKLKQKLENVSAPFSRCDFYFRLSLEEFADEYSCECFLPVSCGKLIIKKLP